MEPTRIWEMAKFSNHQSILTRFNISALMLIAKLFQILRLLENVTLVSKFSVVKEILCMEAVTNVGTITASILLAKGAGKLLIQLTLEQERKENGSQKNSLLLTRPSLKLELCETTSSTSGFMSWLYQKKQKTTIFMLM